MVTSVSGDLLSTRSMTSTTTTTTTTVCVEGGLRLILVDAGQQGN